MTSQQWRGNSSSLNTQIDTATGLLPQYFNTGNPNFTNLWVTIEQPDALGRFGFNKQYQMYSSPFWQRSVGIYTQEAIFSKDSAKIDLALKALEFTFKQQLSNGNFSFTPVPDQPANTQQDYGVGDQASLGALPFFMAGLGTALQTYQNSTWFQTDAQNQSFRSRLAALTPKIQKTLDFLTLDSNVNRLKGDSRAANRTWHKALSYYSVGEALGDAKAQQIGLSFAQEALSQFDSRTGIFLENGGGDSSYQAVSLVLASRFSLLLDQNNPLRATIQQAVISGAAWEQSKVLSTGEVSTEGNTRVHLGGEVSMNIEKGVDVKTVALAFSYAAMFSNESTYWQTAQRISDFYNLNYTTPGTLSFSSSTFTINEDGTPVQAITVIRTGGSYGSVSAALWVKSGTATDPRDYPYTNNNPPTVTFADGDTTPKVIQFPVIDDRMHEPNETVNLSLVWPKGRATIGTQNTAVLTIVDNDLQPTVAISEDAVSLLEGNSGTSLLTFTVNLSNPSSQTITVPFATQDGTAIAGLDYTANSGTLTFKPGEVSKKVIVRANSDNTLEPDETFSLKLGTPTNASLGTVTKSTATIINNDSSLAFSSPSFTINEDGTPGQAITITRTGSSSGAVSAALWVRKGTAGDPKDYPYTNDNPPIITFADGDMTPKVVQFPVIDDAVAEPNETVNLSLMWPKGGVTIGEQNTAVLTIVDNDSPPAVTISPSTISLAEGNGTVPMTFTVSLSNPFRQTITVPFTTEDGTAIAGSDYVATRGTLTFNPGEVSKQITLQVNSNTVIEANETFSLKLGTPTNAVLGTNIQSVLTITDAQTGSAKTLIGGSDNDFLTGGAGSDTLSGGQGNDTLTGFTGNDFYYIENMGDIIVEAFNAGSDTVRSFISYTLDASLERLGLQGTDDLNGTGNSFDNLVAGNAGNNLLDGQAGNDTLMGRGGADTLFGGIGDDIAYVDSTSDIVVENFNAGTDTVRSSISYRLNSDLERLGLQGSGDLVGIGNELANAIVGNRGNNRLDGQAGKDSLSGGLGSDTLNGGAGDDVLSGHLGNDRFLFATGSSYVAGAIGVDRITDFRRTADNTDKIALSRSTFTAGTSFANVTTDALAATSESLITFSSNTGKLFYNQNGAEAGFGTGGQFAIISNVNALAASDFVVVA
jgi:Ca2+-binding RTX toxin-like protein